MKRIFSVLIFNFISYQAFSQNISVARQEEDKNIYVAVEHQAVPNSGNKQFYSDFVNEYSTPEVGNGIDKLKLFYFFVVEKDGMLTDIKIF